MKIGLIGFGNIGSSFEEILFKNRKLFKEKLKQELVIKTVLIKNINKERKYFDKDIVFTDKFEDILNDREIDLLVELSSGLDQVASYIKEALKNKKHVVSSNKGIVSKYFEEITKIANENDRAFVFEASVGGGVHIVKPLLEDSRINDIDRISGILNGTCNYILTSIEDNDTAYEDALKQAQKLGFAELDPSADVEGTDSLRKLRILSSIGLGKKVCEEDIPTFGISNISLDDIDIFRKNSYKVKLLAETYKKDGQIFATVMPNLVDKDSVYYNIKSSLNLISYHGDYCNDLSFQGHGAGGYPTSDSVIRDAFDVVSNTYINAFSNDTKAEISSKKMKEVFYINCDKSLKEKLVDLIDKEYDLDKKLAIFTKEIELGQVLDLFKDLDKKDFFIAKVLRKDK